MSAFTDPLNLAISKYEELYKSPPKIKCFAPGRVNLIGEHTDYNDGFVLPFALPYRTVVVGDIIEGDISEVHTTTLGAKSANFNIHTCVKTNVEWTNYVKGTIAQYKQKLPTPFAIRIVIASDVPMGSGLSSSASLEVAIATFIEYCIDSIQTEPMPKMCPGGLNDKVMKALNCQRAEHEWADTPCGIMDQYISSMGAEGNLLLIDCRTQKAEMIPFGDGSDPDTPVVVIANSNVKHTLSGSEYPERVQQCKDCVKAVKEVYNDCYICALRDVTMTMLNDVKNQQKIDDITYRRGKHAIDESDRTKAAAKALQQGKWTEVGRYMNESHNSLRDDYQVSCVELDALVDAAREVDGVYGSRMTGGGFGGCTVTLVRPDAVQKLKDHLETSYKTRMDKTCILYECTPSAGASII